MKWGVVNDRNQINASCGYADKADAEGGLGSPVKLQQETVFEFRPHGHQPSVSSGSPDLECATCNVNCIVAKYDEVAYCNLKLS